MRRRVYRPHLFFILPWVFLGGWLILVATSLIQNGIGSVFKLPGLSSILELAIMCLMASPFLAIGIWSFASPLSIRLVLSDEGIEYHDFGYSIIAKWQDVGSISFAWIEVSGVFPFFHGADKLRLKRSTLRANKIFRLFVKIAGFQWSIPIGWFALDWRNSHVGREIRKYVPHLNF